MSRMRDRFESKEDMALALELARRDLLDFAHFCIPEFDANWHHELIYTVLDRVAKFQKNRVILQAPPRHGKTMSAGIALPAFLLGLHPGIKILYTTYAAKQGETNVRDLKRFMESEEYQAVFPGLHISGKNSSSEFEMSNGSRFTMRGVGQGIGGQPANLLICDDLVSGREDAESEAMRNKTWEWYVGEATARLEWPNAIVLMFTRWHHDDVIGRVLKSQRADEWLQLRFPAIMDEFDTKPAYDPRKEGEVLWPGRAASPDERELLTKAEMQARMMDLFSAQKEHSPYTFDSVYQQRPSPRDGTLFKKSWFRYYKQSPVMVAAQCDQVMLSVDATFGKSKNSDYVSILVAGRQGARIYVLDEINERMSYSETKQALRNLQAKWPMASVLIERKANGDALLDEMSKEIPNVLPFEPGNNSKYTRAQVAAERCEAGQVWLPTVETAPWIDEWIQDLVGFGTRPHDDRVDSLSQLCIRWGTAAGARDHLLRILGGQDRPGFQMPNLRNLPRF
jgi:predicted phage terminase large subunit-like protein